MVTKPLGLVALLLATGGMVAALNVAVDAPRRCPRCDPPVVDAASSASSARARFIQDVGEESALARRDTVPRRDRRGRLAPPLAQPDGSFRDAVFFSIVDDEWPDVKERLESKLRMRA